MPVYKKGAVYYAAIEMGKDPATGKRVQRWVRGGATKRASQEVFTHLRRERDTSTALDLSAMTTDAYLDH